MKKEIFIILIALFFINAVSAEMFISQPSSVYNLGDKIPIKVTIRPLIQTEGYLSVQIRCSSDNFEVFRNYYSVNPGEEKVIDSLFLVTNYSDSCYLYSSFGEDSAESIKFSISKDISVSANFQKKIYNPGELISIIGEARKINGANVEGFFELSGESIESAVKGVVSNGKFVINYTSSKSVSGVKSLRIYVYEKNNKGSITNYGEYNQEIEIRSILSKIEVVLSSDSIIPGERIDYEVNMIDQEGKKISADGILTIIKPNGKEFLKEVLSSNSSNLSGNFVTEKNYLPGYWKVEVSSGDINGKKLLYIGEIEEASFEMANGTIIVKNVGNIPYKKAIKIMIGSNEIIREISLGVGEGKKYEVSAPDGEYNIEISDGTNGVNLGFISLTGNSINLGEVKGLGGILEGNGILLAFIVLILGLFVVLFGYRNGYLFKKNYIPVNSNYVEPTSVLGNGIQQNASVICLEIRSISGTGIESVKKVIEIAKSRGASIHINGDHKIMIFAPVSTKTQDNLQIALKVVKEMNDVLKDHNRRYRDKIDFGLSVNHGEIIAERKSGELNFISRGNLIREAKRLSGMAKEEVLFSDISHRGLSQNAEFIKDNERNAWKLGRIRDNDQYKEFIDNFKEKNFGKKT